MSVQGWYPLALAEAIAPGTSAGAVLKGMEIVVWRNSAGLPRAWEDRCPHRGMKMSFGKSIGLAAQIRQGQTIIEIGCEEKDLATAKLAAERANYKFACPTQIVVVKKAQA